MRLGLPGRREGSREGSTGQRSRVWSLGGKLRWEGRDSSLRFNRQKLCPRSHTREIRNHSPEPGKQRLRRSERGLPKHREVTPAGAGRRQSEGRTGLFNITSPPRPGERDDSRVTEASSSYVYNRAVALQPSCASESPGLFLKPQLTGPHSQVSESVSLGWGPCPEHLHV